MTELLFDETRATWPKVSDIWVPKMIRNRDDWYQWALGQGEYAAGETTTEVIINKDGKEEIKVIKAPKVKGPTKPVELQGKVGGRRRAVKPRTPSTKPTGKEDK